MKRKSFLLILAAFLAVAHLYSCDRLGDPISAGHGRLNFSFLKGGELFTKTYLNLPDTSDFLMTVSDASGRILYDGKYGNCPESMDVVSGTYNVKVVSSDFSRPSFNTPQFGDEQCVFVPDGGTGNVRLLCRQLNSGIRLYISSSFLVKCPDAVLFLKSASGKLMYSYLETRTAYFSPGPVSLIMTSGGTDEVLMVRDLQEREMLSVRVTAPDSDYGTEGVMSISVDTSRIWTNGECLIGEGDSGVNVEDALSVSEARKSAGKDEVWVSGYVVGGDLTSASASFEYPFESRTNILLGPRASTIEKTMCLSVQLPAGDIRERLNLVDNPSLLGKRICVKGDIVNAYYGIPGMKNTIDYQLL